ncbi:MAG: GntR family transcriptional regulator [Prosthecobacter sp.]|nr:GntR family transcriptional regulator [Prosthecobacter sp.]
MKTKHAIPQRSTLVQQVTVILRQGIRDNVWGAHLPGEVELSRSLQVSRMTLRAALETLTREGWLSSSQGRRRQVMKKAVSRVTQTNNRIVLLTDVPIVSMSVFHLLQVNGLREQLAKAGFDLDVHVSAACFSGRPSAALERLRAAKPAVVWVLLNSSVPMQHWFMDCGLPCVVIGAPHPGITLPTIGTDYHALGRHAAGMFLRRGHRQLAVLVPAQAKAGDINSITGFRAACNQVDDANMSVIEHDGTPTGIRRCLAMMLKKSPPTGLLVALPACVLTVMSTLSCLSVRVPQDISIISRDSESYLDFMVPTPARYMINVPHCVQKISRTILAIAHSGAAPVRNQLLQREFVNGESLGKLGMSVLQ